MSIRAHYNTTVEVRRATQVADGEGGYTESFVKVASIRCRIRPASASERNLGRREESYLTHVLYCDDGEDIQRQDRLVEQGTERTLTVLDIRIPSIRGRHIEVDLEERIRAR